MFSEKGNTFRDIPFSRFYQNSRKFLYYVSTITSATLFPRRQQCPRRRIQVTNLCCSKPFMTWQLFFFSRLLLTDFSQHNWSTQGEKDLRFGHRYLCFAFAFMIWAFELIIARENTCIRNFESDDTAQSVPFSSWEKVQFHLSKKSTENSIQIVSAPGQHVHLRVRFWRSRSVALYNIT